jgi:hypothetical protein
LHAKINIFIPPSAVEIFHKTALKKVTQQRQQKQCQKFMGHKNSKLLCAKTFPALLFTSYSRVYVFHIHTHTTAHHRAFLCVFYDAVSVEVTPPKEQGAKCKFIISDGRKNMYRKEINNLLAMRVNTKLKNIENNFSQR